MSKYDYEIAKYKVSYNGKVRRMNKFFYTEEQAVEFARSVESKQPCIYQIRRMIMEDIKA